VVPIYFHFSAHSVNISYFPGIKFVVISDTRQTAMDVFLKRLYEIYADFALKNPFYSLDMPVRWVHISSLIIYLPLFLYWGLELWCLTPLSTMFQLYCGDQFYWWGKPEDQEKTTDLSQVNDKIQIHNIRLHRYKVDVNPTTTRPRPWRSRRWDCISSLISYLSFIYLPPIGSHQRL
jgi:hypothetical protein